MMMMPARFCLVSGRVVCWRFPPPAPWLISSRNPQPHHSLLHNKDEVMIPEQCLQSPTLGLQLAQLNPLLHQTSSHRTEWNLSTAIPLTASSLYIVFCLQAHIHHLIDDIPHHHLIHLATVSNLLHFFSGHKVPSVAGDKLLQIHISTSFLFANETDSLGAWDPHPVLLHQEPCLVTHLLQPIKVVSPDTLSRVFPLVFRGEVEGAARQHPI